MGSKASRTDSPTNVTRISVIEIAAKGLYGDIVIEPSSLSGMAYYDEFSAYIKEKLPQMRLAGVPPGKDHA